MAEFCKLHTNEYNLNDLHFDLQAPMVSYDHHDNDSDPSTYGHEHGTRVSASSLPLFVALIGASTQNLQQTSNSQQGRDGSAPDVFINSWAVKIHGGPDDADAVARRYGFHNLGLVREQPCRSLSYIYGWLHLTLQVQGFDDVYQCRLGGREMQRVRSDSPYTSSIASDKLVSAMHVA